MGPRWHRAKPGWLLACAAPLAVAFPPSPAWADSAEAFCVLSRHDHTAPILRGPCRWSQRQGNVRVLFGQREFLFAADEEGRTYSRRNREGVGAGPVFTREGDYTLTIDWLQPGERRDGP